MIRAKLIAGIVKKFNTLPTNYYIGSTKINLEKCTDVVKEQEGFYEVLEATPSTYQSVEPLLETDLVGNQYIERVRDWTQAEIDDYIEAQAEQAERTIIDTEISDGIEASNKLKVYLKRNLTEQQYKQARNLVAPVWIALRRGDWDIALDEIIAIDTSQMPIWASTMQGVIIQKIQEYLGI